MRDPGRYRTSSFCTGGACLGVEVSPDGVEIVEVAVESGATIRVSREEWEAFVAGVKNGEFDLD